MRRINIIILAIVGLTILSCSTDDNNKISDADIIVGLWKPIKYVENYKDNTTTEIEYNTCDQMSSRNYIRNGNLDIKQFSKNNTSGMCEQTIEPKQISGSWKKISDGKYEIKSAYKYTQAQQIVSTGNNFPDLVVFENNNTTMKIIFYGRSFIPNVPNLKESYTEYERLE